MRRRDQPLPDSVVRRGDVDPDDVGSRRHDADDGPIREPHDAGDEFAFAGFENARRFRFGNDRLDFFVGDFALAFLRQTQQAEDEVRRGLEQPDDGRRRRGERRHDRRHGACDALGVTQGQRLRHQLADDD